MKPRQLAVMRKYEEMRGQKRIFFTTFHQSMDYEDFVEGIKPQVEDGQVGYSVEKFLGQAPRKGRKIRVSWGLSPPDLSGGVVVRQGIGGGRMS